MSNERLMNPEQNAVVLARLEGSGPTTITAFCSAYDHEFPSALDGVGAFVWITRCIAAVGTSAKPRYALLVLCASYVAVSRKEFKFCMDVINQTVEDYFPCLPCYACGYFCCFTTCGLSLFVPEPCTKDLEANVEVVLKRLNNREEFLYRGIVWKFRRDKRTRSSWLEICHLIYE